MAFEDENAYLDAKITKVEALIDAYEDAILALATSGAQSYTLDTGQSRQTVTKAQLSDLRLSLRELENRRSELRTRRYGSAHHARPAG